MITYKEKTIRNNRVISRNFTSAYMIDNRIGVSNQRNANSMKVPNKIVQLYEEVISDRNGTNPLPITSGIFPQWLLAVFNRGAIPPLKRGVRPLYNIMRQRGFGIGPGSCNAVAEYCSPITGQLYCCAGNSYVQQAGVHAELQAITNVLGFAEAVDGNFSVSPLNISRIYVELSPCNRCHHILQGLVPNATVMYDYDYSKVGQVNLWKKYKRNKLNKKPYGIVKRIPREVAYSTWRDSLMNVF